MVWIKRIEKIIMILLVVLMGITLLFASIELGFVLIKNIIEPPFLLIELQQLLEIFGLFVLILIGFELFQSIKTYIEEDKMRVEVVISVAIIAVSNKIITLDLLKQNALSVMGIGGLIVGLTVGYYLIKKSQMYCEDSRAKK